MSKFTDIAGYYAVLGLTPVASAEDIKRAFRELAKAVHPDHNPGDAAATARFQKLNEAYQILSDPVHRANYDSACTSAPQAKDSREPMQPVVCSCCGAVSAQIRYAIFWYVMSFLVITYRRAFQGIYCVRCAQITALKASAISWVLGWWGFPWGPIWTVASLWRNLGNGTMPEDANAQILGRQGIYFVEQGNVGLGAEVIDQALTFAIAPKLRESLRAIRDALDIKVSPSLKNAWTLWRNYAFWLQAAPVALCLLLVFLANLDSIRDKNVRREQAHADKLVAVLAEPNTSSATLTRLRPFEDFDVLVGRNENGFERVVTKNRRIGYLPSNAVLLGSGEIDQRTRCFPNGPIRLFNGAVITQRFKGPHHLTVKNGQAQDAVVKLRSGEGHTALSFFVRASSETTIETVPEGTYTIEFAYGRDYSPACGYFLADMNASKFVEPQAFETTQDGRKRYYSILEITLNAVAGGNAKTTSTDEIAFDRD